MKGIGIALGWSEIYVGKPILNLYEYSNYQILKDKIWDHITCDTSIDLHLLSHNTWQSSFV